MTWSLESDRPIYVQLVEQIELNIIAGAYRAGDRLPPVRDLAAQASVNPNTMQKALAELERKGLLYTQRTNGRFITDNTELIQQTRESIASQEAGGFLVKMGRLGYSKQETVSFLSRVAEGGK